MIQYFFIFWKRILINVLSTIYYQSSFRWQPRSIESTINSFFLLLKVVWSWCVCVVMCLYLFYWRNEFKMTIFITYWARYILVYKRDHFINFGFVIFIKSKIINDMNWGIYMLCPSILEFSPFIIIYNLTYKMYST